MLLVRLILLAFFTLLGCIFLILGGIQHKMTKDYDTRVFNEQEKRITLYMKYNAKVYKSVTFTNREIIPTGSYVVTGYLNGNKKMQFNAFAGASDNYQFNGIYSSTDELDHNMKQKELTVD